MPFATLFWEPLRKGVCVIAALVFQLRCNAQEYKAMVLCYDRKLNCMI